MQAARIVGANIEANRSIPAQRDTPDVALASFAKIIANEAAAKEQGEFGFKSLKQLTKLTFKLGRYADAVEHYKVLLTYTRTGVTRNVAEKSINGILDYVSSEQRLETSKMQEFYEITMKALEEAKNEVSPAFSTSCDRLLTYSYVTATEHQDESQIGETLARSKRVPSTQQDRQGAPRRLRPFGRRCRRRQLERNDST